jgi:hypothetical protein
MVLTAKGSNSDAFKCGGLQTVITVPSVCAGLQSPTADLTENTQRFYESHCVLLSVRTVATAVKATCCGVDKEGNCIPGEEFVLFALLKKRTKSFADVYVSVCLSLSLRVYSMWTHM